MKGAFFVQKQEIPVLEDMYDMGINRKFQYWKICMIWVKKGNIGIVFHCQSKNKSVYTLTIKNEGIII